jgi:hypothetical protein
MAVRYLGTNSPDGTSLGLSTGEKISFYGATPVTQPADANQSTVSSTTSSAGDVAVLANSLRDAMVNLGLIKGSA